MCGKAFGGCHGRRYARGEWFGRHGGRGFDHMRGGRGRVFDQGDLRFVILRLIAEKPRHGYEIIKDIEERLAGSYSPSPGVIYPTLTLLEELGYTTVTASQGGKKLYAMTAEGEAALAANRALVDAIFARIGEISAAHGGGPSPQLVRAMQNLRLALRLRLARGPLSEAESAAIVAALDAAAVTVERT
ncbi:MAG TPA: PadR family transcriptional regulator [Stellaceae bacterium]|nr:PadR family transcriptional regulator [Stellaceae bacterium]